MTINGHNDNSTVGNDGDKDIVLMEVASDLAAVFIQPFTWAVISSTMMITTNCPWCDRGDYHSDGDRRSCCVVLCNSLHAAAPQVLQAHSTLY